MEKLADLKVIAGIDKSDMLSIIGNFSKQWREAEKVGKRLSLPACCRNPEKLVITGLGGSAMGGDILRSYLREEIKIPVFVNRNYTLPRFVDENTLLVAVSYSGNTEETISAYHQAMDRSAKIAIITSGGQLKKLGEKQGAPMAIVPKGMPPRTALGYLFLPLLIMTGKLGLAGDKGKDIEETGSLLEKLSKEYNPSSSGNNIPKKLAKKLFGKLPLIYGSESLEAACLRWKTQLNENSKILTYPVVFPELNHNEIVGWEGMEELRKNIEIIILRDADDHKRIQKRIKITREVIGTRPAGIEEINSRGKSLLARLFSLIYLGDWVSFYLAILYGVDPTPVKPIESLKRRLVA